MLYSTFCACLVWCSLFVPSRSLSNSAPLDKTLAYYRLNGYNGAETQLTHSFVPVSCGAVLSVHHTDPEVFSDAGTPERPILTLNHGYPESSYIWRLITPEISRRVPVVVADRPGYGLSTVCPNGTDERTTAGALIDAVTALFGEDKSVVLAGHDRGARAMHRAAVDIGQGAFPQINAIGLFLADIVPFVAEWDSFSNPKNAAGYFHWSFLPRIEDDFSLNVIMAYGGGAWVDHLNAMGAGTNEEATALFRSGHAFEIYHTFFDQVSVTNASIHDYWNGATYDYEQTAADQQAGRKIKMPMHVEYSHLNMVTLSGFDMQAIWQDYVEPSAGLTLKGVGGGVGHFVVELAPKETLEQLHAFLHRLGVSRREMGHVVEHAEL